MWGSNTAFWRQHRDRLLRWHHAEMGQRHLQFRRPVLQLIRATNDVSSTISRSKAGASYTSGQWTFGINNYWSPDYFQVFGNRLMRSRDRSPMLSRASCSTSSRPPSAVASVTSRSRRLPHDYTYWNAGLTLGFMEQLFRRCPLLGYGLSVTTDCIHAKWHHGMAATRASWEPSRPSSRSFRTSPKNTSHLKGRPTAAPFFFAALQDTLRHNACASLDPRRFARANPRLGKFRRLIRHPRLPARR